MRGDEFRIQLYVLSEICCVMTRIKIQLTQALHVYGQISLRVLAEYPPEQFVIDFNFHRKILFSGEPHCWIRENANIHGMHPANINVWCGFGAGSYSGPYFLDFFSPRRGKFI